MMIDRGETPTPRSTALARDLAHLPSQCVGCKACRGLCHALIEALILPTVILGDRRAS